MRNFMIHYIDANNAEIRLTVVKGDNIGDVHETFHDEGHYDCEIVALYALEPIKLETKRGPYTVRYKDLKTDTRPL